VDVRPYPRHPQVFGLVRDGKPVVQARRSLSSEDALKSEQLQVDVPLE
jgi:hypothetical protein